MKDIKSTPFSVSQGYAEMRQKEGEITKAYIAIVLGIILHWVWEVLVASLNTDQGPDFGTWVIVVSRFSIALIVGLVSFVGIWKQLKGTDPTIRFFIAVNQGFALDALASPVVGNAAQA